MEFLGDVRGQDLYKPSLFELIFQEQLRDNLQPAVKYVLGVLANQYPRYILRLVNWHEEVYALLMLVVERHYLQKHNGSFTENFYGLKRRRRPIFETPRAHAAVGPDLVAKEGALRKREIRWSLFFLVVIPYLRIKAREYWEDTGGGTPDDVSGGTSRPTPNSASPLRERLRYWYKVLYPWVDTAYEFLLLGYNIAYLFEKTPYYRPWLGWIRVDIRRLGADDVAPTPASPSSPRPPRPMLQRIMRALLRLPAKLVESLKVVLPLSIFFIKFLEWWYSPNSPARALAQIHAGPLVPPPKMLKPHPQGVLQPEEKIPYGMCPICRKSIANATAVPSGYVFCYKCVFQAVEKDGRCPVTLVPTTTWMLRKVLM